jgi:hypothetical protein
MHAEEGEEKGKGQQVPKMLTVGFFFLFFPPPFYSGFVVRESGKKRGEGVRIFFILVYLFLPNVLSGLFFFSFSVIQFFGFSGFILFHFF